MSFMTPKNGLYGSRESGTPYGTLDQPIVPQRLAVTNAYVDKKVPGKRKRGRRGRRGVPPKFGGDPKHALSIDDRDILIEDLGHGAKHRPTKRPNSTTTLQSTLRVSAGVDGLGDKGEAKWQTRQRFRYVGFAKTPADKNVLGEHDRAMVPVLNGGLVDVKNKSPHVIPAHTLLKVDFPKDDVEAMRIKSKVGSETGQDPHKIPLFLTPYDPKSHKETAGFITEAVVHRNANAALAARDPEKTAALPVYEANRFGDQLMAISALMDVANEIEGGSADEVYAKLKGALNGEIQEEGGIVSAMGRAEERLREVYDASTRKTVTDAYAHRIQAVMRVFTSGESVGTPFNTAKPDLSKGTLSQLVRYFQTKDNALEGLLASIQSIASMETGDVVALSLTDAAPGKPLRILILS